MRGRREEAGEKGRWGSGCGEWVGVKGRRGAVMVEGFSCMYDFYINKVIEGCVEMRWWVICPLIFCEDVLVARGFVCVCGQKSSSSYLLGYLDCPFRFSFLNA